MVQLSCLGVAVANQSGAVEFRDHFKNEASSKSHTSSRNLVVFICLIFFSTFSVFAQELKPRIAVVDLQSDVGLYEASKTNFLTKELVSTNRYTVVERAKVEQVISELGLQSTPYSISGRATEIGNLLGVEKVITGKVLHRGENGFTVSISLIDIETGTIEATTTMEQKWDKIKKKKGNVVSFFESDASNVKLMKRLLEELLS
jgi:TolB-like protein